MLHAQMALLWWHISHHSQQRSHHCQLSNQWERWDRPHDGFALRQISLSYMKPCHPPQGPCNCSALPHLGLCLSGFRLCVMGRFLGIGEEVSVFSRAPKATKRWFHPCVLTSQWVYWSCLRVWSGGRWWWQTLRQGHRWEACSKMGHATLELPAQPVGSCTAASPGMATVAGTSEAGFVSLIIV